MRLSERLTPEDLAIVQRGGVRTMRFFLRMNRTHQVDIFLNNYATRDRLEDRNSKYVRLYQLYSTPELAPE